MRQERRAEKGATCNEGHLDLFMFSALDRSAKHSDLHNNPHGLSFHKCGMCMGRMHNTANHVLCISNKWDGIESPDGTREEIVRVLVSDKVNLYRGLLFWLCNDKMISLG